MRHLLLVGAVVVHHPDLFVPATLADEIDLALRDTRNPSAKTKDNLVGKTVCNDPHRIRSGIVRVLLPQHLRRSLVLHVVEPSLNCDFARSPAQVAEGQHRRVRRRRIPCRKIHVARLSRFLQWIKTLGNEFENSSVVEVLSSAAFCGSALDALKSAAARRTRSTPNPVPVRIQSCAKPVAANNNSSAIVIHVERWIRIRLAERIVELNVELNKVVLPVCVT